MKSATVPRCTLNSAGKEDSECRLLQGWWEGKKSIKAHIKEEEHVNN